MQIFPKWHCWTVAQHFKSEHPLSDILFRRSTKEEAVETAAVEFLEPSSGKKYGYNLFNLQPNV